MKQFKISDRLASFKYAFAGLRNLVKNEHNARIHLAMAITAIFFGLLLDINLTEWALVFLSIGAVLITEILNTAIEKLADFVEPKWNQKIGDIKDYGAAAVLTAAITALLIGSIIFVPKLLLIIKNDH